MARAGVAAVGSLAGMDQPAPAVDVERIERDLEDVERALERLDAGTYWTDEVTGQPLDGALLAEHPTARRNGTPGAPA